MAGLLLVLVVIAYGPQLRPGGFYNDDWSYLISARYSGGYFDAVGAFHYLWFRPLMTLYWPATFGVLGTNPTWHEAWTLVVAAAMSTLVYALMRELGVARLHALLIAVLALLLPTADSTRLWPAMSANVLSVTLYLAGVLTSLRALRAHGRRGLLLHASGLALLLCSVMLYEITFALVLVTGALYVVLAGRRGAHRWAVDVAATVPLLVFVTSHTFYTRLPAAQMLDHATKVARETGWVLTRTIWPPAAPGWPAVVLTCAAVLAVLLTAAWRLRHTAATDPARAELGRWLAIALGAVVYATAAYAAIVPSSYLSPHDYGELNRANVAGGVGVIVLVYAVLVLAARLAGSWLGTPARRNAVVAVVALLIAAGSLVQIRRDQPHWERATQLQDYLVDTVARELGPNLRDATVMTFNWPIETAPHVLVFAAVWDLSGALMLHYDDTSLHAYPALPDSRIDCGPREAVLHNSNDSFERQAADYGRLYFVDMRTERSAAINDRPTCRRRAAAFLGPDESPQGAAGG